MIAHREARCRVPASDRSRLGFLKCLGAAADGAVTGKQIETAVPDRRICQNTVKQHLYFAQRVWVAGLRSPEAWPPLSILSTPARTGSGID
jgi:hypothetical protein